VNDLARAFEVVAAGSSFERRLPAADTMPAGHDVRGLRVAWWDDAGPIEPSPAVRRAVQEAVNSLAAAGVETVRLDGRLAEEAAWLHLAVLSADGGADIRRLFAGTRPIPPVARLLRLGGLSPWLRPLLAGLSQALGGGIEAVALRATGPRQGAALAALDARRIEFATRFAAVAAPYDALVCPVSALPALPHGAAARLVLAAAPCLLANLLDLPAGTVPITRVRPDEEGGRAVGRDPVVQAAAAADRNSRGLPVGVQVVGTPGAGTTADPLRPERIVLDVMRLLEQNASSRTRSNTSRVG
jgi:fatty acid amide hydrolase